MKYHLEIGHISRMQEHGWISFEQFLTAEQVLELRQECAVSAAAQLNKGTLELKSLLPWQLYKVGRDHWRTSEAVRRFACRPSLAKLVMELFEVQSVRLAYTQWFGGQEEYGLGSVHSRAEEPFVGEGSLQEISPLQGLVGAVLLCLEPSQDESEESIWPQAAGDATFVSAEHDLGLASFAQIRGGRYLWVAFGKKTCVYVHNARDPLTNDLRGHEYSYGDRLADDRNPLLIR